MVEILKEVKRQLKQSLGAIQEELSMLENENRINPKKQKERMEKIRKELGVADRRVKDLENQWRVLRPNEKAYYANKVKDRRNKYEQYRRRLF